MNGHKIKFIRKILNKFYKDQKKYLKVHKIRHLIIKYIKLKKIKKSIYLMIYNKLINQIDQ